MRLPLYLPGEYPMLGMRSSVDPASLSRGYWRVIENMRISRISATARLGCDELTSGVIAATSSYRGHWVGRLDGTEYCYVAYRFNNATTRIYSINLSSWVATEISDATTRFATDGNVCFAPYRELGIADGTNEGKDCLYISNGTADVPRCTKSGSLILDLLYNFDISTLTVGSYRPIPMGYFNLNDPANTTLSVSDADVTCADNGSSAPLNQVVITVGTATDVGDYANIAFGAGSCVNVFGNTETAGDTLDLSKSRQLGVLFYDNIGDPIHNYANIEVTQSGQTQIYDAQGAGRIDPAIVPMGGGYYLAAFNLEGSVASGLTAVSGIRTEFARQFGGSRTFRIAGVFAMGRIPQGVSYEMSIAKMYSRVESAGITLAAQPPAAISEYGVSRDIPYKFPSTNELWYGYRVDWGGTSLSNADATFLYRQEPGEPQAYFVADIGISNNPFNDNVNPLDRATFRPSPSAGGRGPVSGRCACYSNDRLFVGGINGGSSQVWISDQTFPLRFRAFATDEDEDGSLDIDSGLSKSFPGEDVYQLVEMPGSLLGVAPVICWTDKGTRRFEGADTDSLSRPTFLNEHGTIYPGSVAAVRGSQIYLDTDFISRLFAGGIETGPISFNKVDDQLEAGDMTKAAAVVWKDRYYLAYRASGATINQKVLVYDVNLGEWTRDSYSEAIQNWAGFAKVGTGSTRKLIGFTEEGRIYHLEKAAQLTDDGTAISITLTSPELHKDMWSRVFWGRVGVVADELAGATWTVTRSDPQNTSNEGMTTGTIDMATNVPDRVWRWDDSSGAPVGIGSPSLNLTISGTYQNGKYIKAIIIETEEREDGADVD